MIVTALNVNSVRDDLSRFKELSLDTETTGLDHIDLPFAVIIASDEQVYYFDERYFPGFWDDRDFLKILDRPVHWIYQNAKFDIKMMLRKISTPTTLCGTVTDIAVQARIQRNDHMAYNLASQGARIGDAKLDIAKEYIKEHDLYEERKDFFGFVEKQPRYDRVPVEVMQPYAEQDARLTLKLFRHYNTLMDADDQRVMDMERKLTPVLYKMEQRGVLLDFKYTLMAYYYEKDKFEELKQSFEELARQPYTNSAKSLQKCLQVRLPTTAKGNPSLTDEVIEDILASDEVADLDKQIVRQVQDIRHFDKRISTYYMSFLNKRDANDVIHCTMWQGGTRTGRMSSSDPNLQNVPKEEDSTDQYVIRGCFKPREGRTFISLDYSQMEYRMMAAYANQVDIIDLVMNGVDFHKATAEMFGVSRKTAKTLNFMILYGGGDAKLAASLGIGLREARMLKTKYFMALPRVELLIDAVIGTGKSRGFIKNWLGRKMYARPDFAYALPNHLIQGGGADIVKQAMVLIDAEFPDIDMVLQVHDQLVFDMEPRHFKHIPRIKEIMESIWEMNGMKLTVDVSWSEQSLAERDMKKGIPIG